MNRSSFSESGRLLTASLFASPTQIDHSSMFQRFAIALFLSPLLCALAQQFDAAPHDTNELYFIDLPTSLKLAGAQSLDIQIAREKLAEAKANYESAIWQFFPWIEPG